QRCNSAGASCTAISGATATTYVLTSSDVGSTIRVKLTATNASGSGTATSNQTAVVAAAPPVVSSVPTISGTAKDGQALTSTTGTWSGTTPITYARQWNRCNSSGGSCVAIAGAAGTSYTVVTADIGSKLNVAVTASNTAGSSTSSSVVTALVVGAAPTNSAVPVISGTAKEGQLLTASTGTWSGSAPISYATQWQSCSPTCTNIAGATAATYRLTATDVGKTIKAVVTATNSTGSASATSAATASVTTGPPVNTVLPTVTGTATAGQVLTATTGTWVGTATITKTTQWKRCNTAGASCVAISGATASTYTLTSTDVGATIRATETATNSVGSAAADSAATSVVAGVPPANTTLPAIAGTANDGQSLSSSTGSWSGTTPITYTRQWLRCDTAGANCTAIAGATSTTYTAQSADVGSKLKVTVTATNTAGNASATSGATAIVAGIAPASTVAPVVTGTAKDGQTLSAGTGTWSGSTPITYTYQWRRCDASGASCADIAGATASAYAVQAVDVGHTLRASITAANSTGSAAATSSATAVVLAAAPVATVAPTVSGAARVATTLTAEPGTWTGTAPITYTYQWRRCNASGASCTDIAGATSRHYTTVSGDAGQTARVVVTATNVAATVGATSSASGVITSGAPQNGTVPTISGTARVGRELAADGGTWTGTPPIALSYQWTRCDTLGAACSDIAGADEAALDLVSADAGHTLRVRVSATNDLGTSTVASGQTATVAVAAAVDPTLDLSGTLVASPGTWLTSASYGLVIHATAGSDSVGLQSITATLDDESLGDWDDPCTGSGCQSTHTVSVDASSLSEGAHELAVSVIDADGRSAESTAEVLIDHAAPLPPTDVTAYDEAGVVHLGWSESVSPDVDSYNILRRSGSGGTWQLIGTSTSAEFADTLPLAGVDAQYVIEAHDTAGNTGSDSSVVEISTDPAGPAPLGLAARLDDDGAAVELDWEPVTGAVGYLVQVERPGDSSYSKLSNVASPTTTARDDDTDAPGDYHYVVRAISASGRVGLASTAATVNVADIEEGRPLITLSGDMIEDPQASLAGEVTLDIDATDGETAPGIVHLAASIDDQQLQSWTQSCSSGGCEMQRTWTLDTATLDDDEHQVTVVATDADGATTQEDFTITTDNHAPSAPPYVWLEATPTGHTVHWTPSSSEDVASYYVSPFYFDSGWSNVVTDADTTSATYDGACEYQCKFTVQAMDSISMSDPASAERDWTLRDGELPGTPTALNATAQVGAVSLDWADVADVAGYLVFRRESGSPEYTQITPTPVTASSFVDDDPQPGASYDYVVRSVDSLGMASDPSAPSSATVPHSSTIPVITLTGSLADHQSQTVGAGTYGLHAHAAESGGAVVYLDVHVDGISVDNQDEPCPLGNCALDSDIDLDTDDYSDGQHLVEVTAVDAGNETTTQAFSFTLEASAPRDIEDFTAEPASDRVHLAWGAPDETDLTTYRVYRGTTAGSLSQLTTTAAPASHYDDPVTTGTYWYAVQAVDGAGHTSPISEAVRVVAGGTIANPVGTVTTTASPYAISLTFPAVTAADLKGYNVYRQTADEDEPQLLTAAPIATPSFTDSTLIPGSTATYTVKAVDDAGREGPASAPQTATATGMRPGAGRSPLLARVDLDYGVNGWETSLGNDGLTPTAFASPVACTASWADACTEYPRTSYQLSPDGRHILTAQFGPPYGADDQLILGDLETGARTVLCATGTQPPGSTAPDCMPGGSAWLYTAGFTPDGSHIRFMGFKAGDASNSILQIPASGGTGTEVVPPTSSLAAALDSYQLSIAADGSMIAWGRASLDPPTPCVGAKFDASGTLLRTFTPPSCNGSQSRPTPDGQGFIYNDNTEGYPRIRIATLDGDGGPAITPVGLAATACCEISPDGARISYWGKRIPMNADGTPVQPVYGDTIDSFWYGTDGLYTSDIESHQLRALKLTDAPVLPCFCDGPRLDQQIPSYPQSSATIDVSSTAPATLNRRSSDSLHFGAHATTVGSAAIDEFDAFVDGSRAVPTTQNATDAAFDLPLQSTGEGRHTVWIAAATASGQERSIQRTLVVDNTAPVASDEAAAMESDTSGQIDVSWSTPTDPQLADGTPGTGVATTSYRYALASGGWSTWSVSASDGFSADDEVVGSALELRVIDHAGNKKVVRAHISRKAHTPPGGCSANPDRDDSKMTASGADYPTWKSASTTLHAVYRLRCSTLLEEATQHVCLTTRVGAKPVTLGKCKTVTIFPDILPTATVKLTWRCTRPYTGRITVYLVGIAEGLLVGADHPTPLVPIEENPGTVDCPSADQQNDAEASAWRHLAQTPFVCRGAVAEAKHACWKRTWRSAPSTFLGRDLVRHKNPHKKGPPDWPVRGWDAHHVIPAFGGGQASVLPQSIGFRCQVHPNSHVNGVYLRRRTGSDGRPGPLSDSSAMYQWLVTTANPLAGRVAHWDYDAKAAAENDQGPVYVNPYSRAIAPMLVGALEGEGTCKSHKAGTDHIKDITDKLESNYIPGIGDSPR
ncbi:MAG: hypothetical protein JWQ18_3580, partial [Conexibacter sp.]|nr:hypothetical protein [Conexibacter sp.]